MLRSCSFLVGLALVAPARASTTHCNSLFSARVSDLAGVADCDVTLLGAAAPAPCEATETADACATRVYDDPESLDQPTAGRAMTAKWLNRCPDGTDTCLEDEEIVCYDGTRPRVYADKAVDLNGDDMYSNGWVFLMGGEGGPCDGDACWTMYVNDDAAFEKAMSTYHPDYAPSPGDLDAEGLVTDARTVNGAPNNFAHFNRVKFDRCSDGASAAEQVIDTNPDPLVTRTAWVYHHGDAIWEGLANYVATAEGRDLGGGGNDYWAEDGVDLPPLANATHILLAGSSDSAVWLVENADRLAELFGSIAPNAEIRIVVDGNFKPMLEGETRYNANAGTTIFDHQWGNPGGALLPSDGVAATAEDYGDTPYRDLEPSWSDRNVQIDQSCLDAHALDDAPCRDMLHVLLNHVSTPFFVVADQRDIVIRDSSLYALDADYTFPLNEYRQRVVHQAGDVLTRYATESEMAPAGADPDSGVIDWSTALFLVRPDDAKHTHFDTNAKFGTAMAWCDQLTMDSSWTISQALHSWLIYDTAFDAVERPGTGGGWHWVTEGHPCGFPQ